MTTRNAVEIDLMSDETDVTTGDLARQLNMHVDSLRAAGIEWVPTHMPTAQEQAAPRKESPSAAPANRSLPLVSALQATLFTGESDPASSPSQLPALPLEQRHDEMEALRQRVAGCFKCKHLAATRTQTVFGVGPLDAEVCFVGEAPGQTEDEQGEPFVGEAGQLLNRIISACGMKREEVYICNVIRCRPPGNRTPNEEEASNCREFLERQLELVRPRYIVALGSCAAQNLLGTRQPLGKLRRKFHDYRGIPVLCTYHPAYLLPHRTPAAKKDVWEDMKMLLERMGRPIPGK